jgi:hypothetical protein
MEWHRPWGSYKILGENPVLVKVITVNPHSRLSLQTHEYRSEIWFALQPGLLAYVDDNIIRMGVLDRVCVQKGVKHRIENTTDNPLQLIELMYGEYDEQDIFRHEDDYGR